MPIYQVREADLRRLQLASELGLDACAIQVQNIPAGMEVDDVAYFFRDFKILPDGIRHLEGVE